MEYTMGRLARLAGVTPRTLRHYDEIGLLKPERVSSSGYRVYGQKQVDLLQQILFYRELGVGLAEISSILSDPGFRPEAALIRHLAELERRKKHIDTLIESVRRTLSHRKGELSMSDSEKFESFKQRLIQENEDSYGAELRAKYTQEAIGGANEKLAGLTEAQYAEYKATGEELNRVLAKAVPEGDPASPGAQQAAGLHRRWLGYCWAGYSKEAHLGLAELYVEDPRFTAYYESIAPGAAAFLRDAIRIYCR
jgi:DNA-binding transcriptional MerR regulator